MFGRSKRTCKDAVPIVAAIAVLACQWASAQYWVSIGAFRAAPAAEELAAEASDRAGMAFSSRAADTPDGSIYRVVAGPFDSRDEAQAGATRVREAGYADGWIVTFAMPAMPAAVRPVAAETTVDSLLDAPVDGIAVDDLSLDDWSLDDDLPPIEVLLEGLPDIAPAEPAPAPRTPTEPVHDVVVPEDYRLNRLRRDARAQPASRDAAGLFRARMKWYSSGRTLPAGDALRERTGESNPLAHNADLRLMWRPSVGPVTLHLDHSTVWLRSEAAGRSPGLTFDQTPTGDARRLMDLTWGEDAADGDGMQRLHRLDRFAAEYRTRRFHVSVGRQALSWGGGMVFQPMDLFNPFSPTTVDQDYKAGDDMLLIERLFGDGSNLQVLAVARREATQDAARGRVAEDASSIAAKYAMVFDDSELELMAARHYGEQILGAGLRIPVGGALLRSDLVWTRTAGRVHLSGLVNADYTFGVAGSPVHVFAEYFHNGFGVAELPTDLADLPGPLLERIAMRGELFNLMRNYLAAGTSFQWHFLLGQTVSLLANLHDSSYVAQTALNYDSSNASRLQVGLAVPIGSAGDEFGTLAVGDDVTIGGGEQGFVRFVRYF